MSTSSTTAPSPAEAFRAARMRAVYQCPEWCERTDHDADMVGPDLADCIHYGPDFGNVHVFADHGQAIIGRIYDDEILDRAFSAAELRQHAADALAAAEWMEQTAALRS